MIKKRDWKLPALYFFVLVSFNSCGLLLKERTVARHGVRSDDFGLPLIVYRSKHLLSSKMAILLSGDGGWMDFNDSLAVRFTRAGYDVLGFNSRTYFWRQKTPEQTSSDFTLLIRKYSTEWKAKKIILNGYSFGADVVPFLYNRLPPDLKSKVTAVQLLSPFLSTDFKIYLTDLISTGDDDRAYKVKDEVQKIKVPVFCFYGENESPKPLEDMKEKNIIFKLLPGDHHYTGGYRTIISSLNTPALPSAKHHRIGKR